MRFSHRSLLVLIMCVCAWLPVTAQSQTPAAPASMVAGVIKASNVRGDVRKINLADKSELPLRNGDTLRQDNAIVTGTGESSAVLVFANGSTVRVGHTTRLEIKEFLMDPLEGDIANVAALTREPTVSRTDLRLEFGEMVGNVKTLDRAAGSTFSVSTPAGAAGIRGTTFRIVYRTTGTGQAFNFRLSTLEGLVVFEGMTTMGRREVQVPVGREYSVTARVDPATNSVVIGPPVGGPAATSDAIPISDDAAAALQSATLQITQVQQQTTFTQIEMQRPPGSPNPPPPGQRPAQPASAPPRTTPGDGR